ncbi:MAG: hypothetical protein HUK14_01540 [Muribaculaceae bacterium]|nr:hypothetical protein [Muribaculaceae bacterium]
MTQRIEAIDSLHLAEAFTQSHKPFDECWSVSMDSELLVIDDDYEHATRFSTNQDEAGRALMVINEQNKEIVLLSIDNRLVASRKGGITDGALLDLEQFHFIEFKTNALGNSEQAVADTFDKAVGQLKETIKLFAEKLSPLDVNLLSNREVFCHIVVSERFPRSRATRQDCSLQFFDETEIELSFNEKLYWNKFD